ncbi:hypothetical protein HPP92_026170 [Vanilla planifolia]|uniref:Uncharacterized protein n=1 Tax=Vanilla planifolia TaxID=51239 RepID=A0A835PGP0_VANPL|nr:hypothetical protein HPP92_026170 [Vanilla planifolia]
MKGEEVKGQLSNEVSAEHLVSKNHLVNISTGDISNRCSLISSPPTTHEPLLYNCRPRCSSSSHPSVPLKQKTYRKTMETEIRGKVLMEELSFSKSFAVFCDLTLAKVAGDDDFEFIPSKLKSDPVVTTADEIVSNGRVRPMYPIFDCDLVAEGEKSGQEEGFPTLGFAICDPSSGPKPSSSGTETEAKDADRKESLGDWEPRSATLSPDRKWKSNSTGSTGSRRQSIRDLIFGRSRSDGDKKFVTLPGKKHEVLRKRYLFRLNPDEKSAVEAEANNTVKSSIGKERGGMGREMDIVTAHRINYRKASVTNRSLRRSYLPYRHGIVGFFCFGSSFQS